MQPDYKIEIEYPAWEDKLWGRVTNIRYKNDPDGSADFYATTPAGLLKLVAKWMEEH